MLQSSSILRCSTQLCVFNSRQQQYALKKRNARITTTTPNGRHHHSQRQRLANVPAGSTSTAIASSPSNSTIMPSSIDKIATVVTNLFPVWVVAAAVLGIFQPSSFSWFSNDLLAPALGITMLGMGLGLTFNDFKRIAAAPWQVLLGFILQYTIMPCLAFIISKALALPLDLTIGLCLVGCSPGGTASNVITYLAKADVALSVAMTTISTMGAVIMTPALTQLLLGKLVPVDPLALVLSTVQVVLLPVVMGAALNQAFPKQVAAFTSLYSFTAVVLIALICGSVVATSASSILGAGFKMLSAVVLLHAGGFGLGYLFCKFLKCSPATCRTTSIEVGMQNSSLAMLMCVKHFSGFVLAPAVCAISACTHSVLGSMLAAYWRWMLDRDGSGGSSSSSSSSSSRGKGRPIVSWDAPVEERVADRRAWIAAYREDDSGAGGVVGWDAPLKERVADRQAWIAAWRRW